MSLAAWGSAEVGRAGPSESQVSLAAWGLAEVGGSQSVRVGAPKAWLSRTRLLCYQKKQHESPGQCQATGAPHSDLQVPC